MGYAGEYNEAMKPKSEGTGHGKGKEVSAGNIYEGVFQ